MATIYGVVMTVDPGHVGSDPVGETEVYFFCNREPAERFAARCMDARHESCLTTKRYEVREYDEESPDRPPNRMTVGRHKRQKSFDQIAPADTPAAKANQEEAMSDRPQQPAKPNKNCGKRGTSKRGPRRRKNRPRKRG